MAIAARFHAFLNSLGRPDEVAEVRGLRAAVARRLKAIDLDEYALAVRVTHDLADPPLCDHLCVLLARLIEDEGYLALPRQNDDATTAELWALRDTLRTQLQLLETLDDTMALLTAAMRSWLPTVAAGEAPSPFRAPLYAQIADFPAYLDRVVRLPFAEELENAGLFAALRGKLAGNLELVDRHQLRLPSRHSSSDPRELVSLYLRGTPFPDFLDQTVSLPDSDETFFSHAHVIGGSGAGKTQFLQNLILHHLDRDDPPALVVVDSQGDLIPKLSRLARFDPDGGDLADRLILVSPRDVDHPPAINIFDVHNERLDRYDAATREQVVAGVIQTFDYLFSGLLGADLTAKQSVFFRYVARLLISLPETLGRNATILDMIALMDDHTPYLPAIANLPPIQRQFFERDFQSRTFVQTKEQIRYRLNAILENPTLERLFTAPATRLDLLRELDRGAIILIDTDKSFLKGASGNFGRIFIALVLQAVLERAAVPERDRRPAFLIVDEAAEYFDGNIDDLLTEARKYRLGCTFAHQYLDQCAASLKSSLAANTSIKLAAGVSMGDARSLAPDLRTTADFIAGQPKGHFAAYIRNVTPQAVSVPVSFGELERRPRMPDAAYRKLRVRNRERVSGPRMATGDLGRRPPANGTQRQAESIAALHSPAQGSMPAASTLDNPATDASEVL